MDADLDELRILAVDRSGDGGGDGTVLDGVAEEQTAPEPSDRRPKLH
ncbi:hypothetical protein M2171_002454 [Bradyrhizobium japonicum USDA 38]|nr:hypothetical protein [Bradyrhizobium japonicum]MCS3893321.1 hypothetical protein [Bradyrhizobium japonicum USDA 38]MCS3945835.1 hypothetical protein [Bradyrhizobium japonicum]